MDRTTVEYRSDTNLTERQERRNDAIVYSWLAEQGLSLDEAPVYGPEERERFDYRDHRDPEDVTPFDRTAAMMVETIDGVDPEHVKGGKSYTDARCIYGERTTSTTTVGFGPVDTLGSLLGTVLVVDGNGVSRTDLARSQDGTTIGMSLRQSRKVNGKKGGRPRGCTCDTCKSCKARARKAASRAKAKDKATGRTIAATY